MRATPGDVIAVNASPNAPVAAAYDFFRVLSVNRRGTVKGLPLLKMAKLDNQGGFRDGWYTQPCFPGEPERGASPRVLDCEYSLVTAATVFVDRFFIS